MAFRGLHIEPLPQSDPEYIAHSRSFDGQLVKLYKLAYKDMSLELCTTWSTGVYFHGTGHCGCVQTRQASEDPSTIKS
ncbi:hypothetical protein BGX28_001091, partial [Mortierella sp. GBA30]